MNLSRVSITLISTSIISGFSFGFGKPAPDFSAVGTDGKRYTAKSLAKSEPVLLVFFAAGCPHNAHGIKDMNCLAKLFHGKLRIAGMTNLDVKQTKQFASKYHADFPVLSDLSGKTIEKFGAQGSLDNLLLVPGGQVIQLWRGYDRSTVRQLEATLKKEDGLSMHLDLSALPQDRQSGCAFMGSM